MEFKGIITEKVIEQINDIRRSGKYNMFDLINVQREAHEREYYELVFLIEENAKAYCNFIIYGKRVENDL